MFYYACLSKLIFERVFDKKNQECSVQPQPAEEANAKYSLSTTQ